MSERNDERSFPEIWVMEVPESQMAHAIRVARNSQLEVINFNLVEVDWVTADIDLESIHPRWYVVGANCKIEKLKDRLENWEIKLIDVSHSVDVKRGVHCAYRQGHLNKGVLP